MVKVTDYWIIGLRMLEQWIIELAHVFLNSMMGCKHRGTFVLIPLGQRQLQKKPDYRSAIRSVNSTYTDQGRSVEIGRKLLRWIFSSVGNLFLQI